MTDYVSIPIAFLSSRRSLGSHGSDSGITISQCDEGYEEELRERGVETIEAFCVYRELNLLLSYPRKDIPHDRSPCQWLCIVSGY